MGRLNEPWYRRFDKYKALKLTTAGGGGGGGESGGGVQKNVRTLEYSKEKDGTQQRGKRHLYSQIREPVQLAYLLLEEC